MNICSVFHCSDQSNLIAIKKFILCTYSVCMHATLKIREVTVLISGFAYYIQLIKDKQSLGRL